MTLVLLIQASPLVVIAGVVACCVFWHDVRDWALLKTHKLYLWLGVRP